MYRKRWREIRELVNLGSISREKIIPIFGGQKWWKSRAWDFLGVITVYFILTSLKFPCILLRAHQHLDLSPLYTHRASVSLLSLLYYSPLMLIFRRTIFFPHHYVSPPIVHHHVHPHVAFTSPVGNHNHKPYLDITPNGEISFDDLPRVGLLNQQMGVNKCTVVLPCA